MHNSFHTPSADALAGRPRWIEIDQAHHVASKTFDLVVPQLSLAAGRLTALIGPNGSGKSTLLGMIAGTRKLAAGSIKLGGSDAASLSLAERSRLGVQLQDAGFNPQYSVRQILALHQAVYGHSQQAVFDHFGVPELARRRFAQLSSGQRQRLQLAMALAHDPHMALFDEPTSNLDPMYEQRFVESLQQARARNTAFSALFVTHTAGVVEACDDVLIVINGRVEAYGEKNIMVQQMFGELGARFEADSNVLDGIEQELKTRSLAKQVFRRPQRLTVYGPLELRHAAMVQSSQTKLNLFSVWKAGAADILESFKHD